jgi:hypothetical protein
MDTRGPRVAAKDAIDEVKSLSAAQKDAIKSSKSGEVNMGDLESSYAFQRMTSNLIVTKQKKNAELDKQYTATPAAAVTLEGRKVEKGRAAQGPWPGTATRSGAGRSGQRGRGARRRPGGPLNRRRESDSVLGY